MIDEFSKAYFWEVIRRRIVSDTSTHHKFFFSSCFLPARKLTFLEIAKSIPLFLETIADV